MTIVGPTNVTGVSDTVSRRRVFTCRPTTVLEEEPCAARDRQGPHARAYRGKGDAHRALPGRDAVLRRGPARPATSRSGIRLALQSILVSPLFVFRLEGGRRPRRPPGAYRIADEDLASRLSFFLWGTGPDAELIAAAQAGQLRTSAPASRQQVRRMLADPRSEALSTRFASQWLRLQDLETLRPEFTEYPLFDETLRDAMRRETELFFDSIVREDRSVLDLLNADYTLRQRAAGPPLRHRRRQRRRPSAA